MTIPLHPLNVPEGFGSMPLHRAIHIENGLIFVSTAPYPWNNPRLWQKALEARQPDVTFVSLNHGWSFFHHWGDPDHESLSRWHDFLLATPVRYGDQFSMFQNIN